MNASTKASFVLWASMALFASTDVFAISPNASPRAAENAKVKIAYNSGKAAGHAKRDIAQGRRADRKAEREAARDNEVVEVETEAAAEPIAAVPAAEEIAVIPSAVASPTIDLPDSLNLPDVAKLPDLSDLKNLVTLSKIRELLSI